MPRVSPEHLEARRRQILDAARRCFVRNGFHATSMQDILREAQLSAGATYRYFRSKEDIVGAIAESVLGELTEVFDELIAADVPLYAAIQRVCAEFERLDAEFNVAPMALQVWAEAVRSPVLTERMRGLLATVRQRLADVVVKYQERCEIGPGEPYEIGKVVLALMPGFILQRAVTGDVNAETFGAGLRSLLEGGKVTDG